MKILAILSFLILLTGTVYADVVEGGMLNAQSCAMADGEASAGSHPGSCAGGYPGVCGSVAGTNDYLSCNDGNTENDKSVGTNNYHGYKASVSNSSITNCLSITQVEAAYEWWVDANSFPGVTTCDIRVDNDSDELSYETYTQAVITCPGQAGDPASTLYIVVSNDQSWPCTVFFGVSPTGGWIQSNALVPGKNQNFFQDVLGFKVTYEIPEFPSLAIPIVFMLTICMVSLRKR